MSRIYELENRLLIPNWRDFKRTTLLGELGFDKSITNNKEIDISSIINDWNLNPSIGIAADLISGSFITNKIFSKELGEAMKFVEENAQDASGPLMSLICKIKSEINPEEEDTKTILEKNIQSVDEFKSTINIELFDKIIAKTKNLTKNFNSNAINWVELARLYTVKNQLEKAEKCIRIALNLAPNNRFVLRSSVRFFIHSGQADKALYYLKNSSFTKNDPWLISAHIATSKYINRFSTFIKNGINLIDSKKFSDFDLTELSSSIGTLELENSGFKKAKKFIEHSLLMPNDNSLAQFEWLTTKENRFHLEPNLFQKVINPFEALANENFQQGQFLQAFYNCINWYLDFPYSKRPLMFGSYIASLLGDYDSSILLCQHGLRLDRNEVGFINNIIYAYCLKGEYDKLSEHINKLSFNIVQGLHDNDKIMLQATLGLMNLRTNNIDEGKNLYKLSIQNSINIKHDFYYNLGVINFTRELFFLNDFDFNEYFQKFLAIKSSDRDIEFLKSNVINIINNSQIGNSKNNTSINVNL